MYSVSSFYCFGVTSDDKVALLAERLLEAGVCLSLGGLILVSKEGINGTVAGEPAAVALLKQVIKRIAVFRDIEFKDSEAASIPFRRFKVDLRDEVITFEQPGLPIPPKENNHLTPSEWQNFLDSGKEMLLLDTRNEYEVALGTFKGAVNPVIKRFTDLPKYVEQQQWDKKRPVLMFCTGGVRCEKAALDLQARGFEAVYQLKGGILNYLKEFPNKSFEGECFVFDHRVSLDQELKPSKRYSLCAHCGDPADQPVDCELCGEKAIVCRDCLCQPQLHTCSKNCAHHFQRRRLAVGA